MLVRWNPFHEIFRIDRDFQGLVGDFFGQSDLDWRPAVDVYEDPEKIVVEAELPGINPENVDVSVDKDKLIIKGSVVSEKRAEKKNFLRAERTKGSFMRSFMLPSSVEFDKILASYNKGVLTISIPKRPENVPRKVDVKVLE